MGGQRNFFAGGGIQHLGPVFLRDSSHRLLLRWHHSCALLPKDLGLCEMRDHVPVQLLWVAGRRRPEPWRCLENPSRMASELILPIAPCRLLLLLAPQSALLQRFWALRGLHDDSRTWLALLKLSCACIAEVLFNSPSREGGVQAGADYIASSSFCALTHPRGALVQSAFIDLYRMMSRIE